MDRFSKLNPRVTLLFFLLIIVQSVIVFNPIYLALNLLISFFYSVKLSGIKAVRTFISFVLPIIIFASLFNMIFTSYGETVMFEIMNKPFTLEGLFYGLTQGIELGAVILWINCYSIVLSSDKLLSVFSGIAPSISLTLSMVLSFIPRLRKNAQEINDAGSVIDNGKSKLKRSIQNLSALVSLTSEESIELSDSMMARGFNKDRRAYSKYSFGTKDFVALCLCILLFTLSIVFKIIYSDPFIFEPKIIVPDISALMLITYCGLCALPLIIDFLEDMRWLYLKSKI